MKALFTNSTFFNQNTLTVILISADFYLPSLDVFYLVEIGLELDDATSFVSPN